MSLVALLSKSNTDFFVKDIYQNEIIKEEYKIYRRGDFFKILYINFETYYDISIEELNTLIQNNHIKISFSNDLIQLSFAFLSKLNPIIKIGTNNFLLKMPFDILFNFFNIISCLFVHISITTDICTKMIHKIYYINEWKYLDNISRNFIASNQLVQKIFNIKKINNWDEKKIFLKSNIFLYKYVVNFDKFSNKYGFFIESSTYEPITDILIKYLNKKYRYDDLFYISPNLLYCSLNTKNFMDNDFEEPTNIHEQITIFINTRIIIHEYVSLVIRYRKGIILNESFYNIYHIEPNFNIYKHNFLVVGPILYDKIFKNSFIFINDDFSNEYDKNIFEYDNNPIAIIFKSCKGLNNIVFPNDISIRILFFDCCESSMNNLPMNVEEIWYRMSQLSDNLPICVKKIKINIINNKYPKLKIPFGCELDFQNLYI